MTQCHSTLLIPLYPCADSPRIAAPTHYTHTDSGRPKEGYYVFEKSDEYLEVRKNFDSRIAIQ